VGLLAAFMAAILVFTMMVTSQANRANVDAQNQKLVDDYMDRQQDGFDTQRAKYTIFDEVESRKDEVPHYMQGYWLQNGRLGNPIYYINESHVTEYKWVHATCYKAHNSTNPLLFNSEMTRVTKFKNGVYRSIYQDRMVIMKWSQEYRYHFIVEEGVSLITEELFDQWRPTSTKFEKIKSYDVHDIEFCDR